MARGQGMIGLDESRHAAERLDPADYLSLGYYGRWLRAFENLLIEDGWIGPGEVDARTPGSPEIRSNRHRYRISPVRFVKADGGTDRSNRDSPLGSGS